MTYPYHDMVFIQVTVGRITRVIFRQTGVVLSSAGSKLFLMVLGNLIVPSGVSGPWFFINGGV